jgi:hypothetical protein
VKFARMKNTHYFDDDESICKEYKEYPSFRQITVHCFLFTFIVIIVIFIWAGTIQCLGLVEALMSISLRAKFKVLISFFQIVLTFQEDSGTSQGIYSIQLHSHFTSWFGFLRILTFDIFQWFVIPPTCLGSSRSQILFSALLPLAFILIVSCLILLSQSIKNKYCNESSTETAVTFKNERNLSSQLFDCALFLSYVMLPVVSSAIFQGIKCQAYQTQDYPDPLYTIYLLADPNIKCEENDRNF